MHYQSTILAASAFFAAANAHMKMSFPVPYAKDKVITSPITAAQYPCQLSNGFTFDDSDVTPMAAGQSMNVTLDGSANHGGGGCQLSVAQGRTPTADTKFKVIATFQGCPATGPDTLKFKVPDSVPNGDHTFAWTWNSRLSGAPELYMNCGPVKISGGSDDTAKFDALPDILVANIGQGCTSVADMNILYPNPGDQLIVEGTAASAVAPSGNCGASGAGGTPASSAAGGASSVAPVVSTATPVSSAAATTNPGGVFAPSASSGDAGAPQSTLTTMVTVTAAPSTPVEATSAPDAGTATAAPPASPSGSTGGGSTCPTDGAVVCNGATQFGLCDHGKVVWQAVAAGTTCSNGVIQKRTTYNRQLKGRIARPRVVPGQDFTPDA